MALRFRSGRLRVGVSFLSLIKTVSQTLKLYRIFKLRKRYFFTRTNRLRVRYVVTSFVVSSLTVTSVLGSMSASVAFSPANTDVLAHVRGNGDDVDVMAYNSGLPDDSDYSELNAKGLSANDFEAAPSVGEIDVPTTEAAAEELAAIEPASAPAPAEIVPEGPREEVVHIAAGETVMGALQNIGVSDEDAYNAVKALSEHMDLRDVKAGQAISVTMAPSDAGMQFAELNMKIDPIKEVVVSKEGLANFAASLVEKEVFVKPNAVQATIKSSLYGSAARAGIPASIVAELIRIYSYEVDFQRDIREGDKLEVLFETYETEDGDFARYGNVLYANLMVEGRSIPLYRFEPNGGRADFYTADGLSIRKTLMKTPIDGARITSGFGMRRHPILGYNKMHKGMDFAASIGTPIYAAGDGVVSFAGRKGAYGNYVAIKHNGSLSSAYAHMHKFAKGLRSGQKVEQGQVIGYVGTTGRSTGPHLHFEVIQSGRQINPANLKLTGQKLAGADLKKFKAQTSSMKRQYVSMSQGEKYAKNEYSSQ